MINARELLDYTKCQSVKLETDETTIEIVNHLTKNKIKVVSHIGINPQKYKNFDTIKSVGKNNIEKELHNADKALIIIAALSAGVNMVNILPSIWKKGPPGG